MGRGCCVRGYRQYVHAYGNPIAWGNNQVRHNTKLMVTMSSATNNVYNLPDKHFLEEKARSCCTHIVMHNVMSCPYMTITILYPKPVLSSDYMQRALYNNYT